MTPAPPIEPWQVWYCDFEPVRGREQGKDRPALVVSSRFHLQLTGGQLITVLPLTTVGRPGWLHRVGLSSATPDSWVITEQIRTLAASRFRRLASEITVTADDRTEVRRVLAQLVDL